MQINEQNFNKIIAFSENRSLRMSSREVADYFEISERIVQRVKEAGTWERWPYIQAKSRYGYNTPEYKAYLKRRGLPLSPPPRYIRVAGEKEAKVEFKIAKNPLVTKDQQLRKQYLDSLDRRPFAALRRFLKGL